MAEVVTIQMSRNGPYLVTGEVVVMDPEGRVVPSPKGTVALCRCGASSTKPFCDGTHSRIGFAAAEAAVPESRED